MSHFSEQQSNVDNEKYLVVWREKNELSCLSVLWIGA